MFLGRNKKKRRVFNRLTPNFFEEYLQYGKNYCTIFPVLLFNEINQNIFEGKVLQNFSRGALLPPPKTFRD